MEESRQLSSSHHSFDLTVTVLHTDTESAVSCVHHYKDKPAHSAQVRNQAVVSKSNCGDSVGSLHRR